MKSVLEYITALNKPIQVRVIESEEQVCYQIEDALSVYNCAVACDYDPSDEHGCLRTSRFNNADLVFVSSDLKCKDSSLEIVKRIERECPHASIVILTRQPNSDANAALMEHGVYIFMLKNGSFTSEHVQRVFNQVNLRLRSKGVNSELACATT